MFRFIFNYSINEEVIRVVVDRVFYRRVWFNNFSFVKVFVFNDIRIANRRFKDIDYVGG